MTSNQIAHKQAQETQRANRVKEKETERSNIAREKETERANKKSESIANQKIFADKQKVVADTIMKGVSMLFNDVSWYNEDPALVKDTASLSYNTPLGNGVTVINKTKEAIPGILVMNWIPTIGSNGLRVQDNVANIAAKNIYSFVRYANSGARNYEPQDLMMYIMAMCECHSFHAAMTRIYSVLLTSKSHNKYYYNAMLQALGVDPDDFRNNIANFRAYINSFAVRLNSYYVPNSMSLFKRRFWMNSTIFKDSQVKKSQDYVFVQQSYGIYDDVHGRIYFGNTTTDKETICPEFKPGANIQFAQIKALGDYMLRQITNSEDAGIMSGDILKAYGDSGLIFTPSINDDYHIESVYSEEVLSQITNATFVGKPTFSGSLASNDLSGVQTANTGYDIHQTTDGTIYQGCRWVTTPDTTIEGEIGYSDEVLGIATTFGNAIDLSNTLYKSIEDDKYVVNMYKDNVTPDENMVATRLTAGYMNMVQRPELEEKAVDNYNYFMSEYGTELCTDGYVITLDPTNAYNYQALKYAGFSILNGANSYYSFVTPMKLLNKLYNFEWSPVIHLVAVNDLSNPTELVYLANTRDCANFAEISRVVLDNMHYTAVLSEFAIPKLGLKVRTR